MTNKTNTTNSDKVNEMAAPTASAIARLRVAVERAISQWAGLDWPTDLTVGNTDLEGDELGAAIAAEAATVEADAERAAELGQEALDLAAAGHWRGARISIGQAASLERYYGDAPSWAPALALAEHLEAVLTVGNHVEGGETDEDYDTGTVVAVDGDMVTVAWSNGERTTTESSALRPVTW